MPPRFPIAPVEPMVFARFEVELAADTGNRANASAGGVGIFVDSSCPTHQSHNNHPRNVAMLPQPTTETGDMRSWMMPTKQTINIITEHTCCTMTVDSATRGQKS